MEKKYIFSTKFLKWMEVEMTDRDWESAKTISQIRLEFEQLKEILDAQYDERGMYL